jgi:hypothetical protein
VRVLICGSREWTDGAAIRRELERLNGVVWVIEGGARGADALGEAAALALGIAVRHFPADWQRYGRAAGPIRNQRMLDEGKPDLVLAFHADLARSKGTADMVRRATKAGIQVRVFEA